MITVSQSAKNPALSQINVFPVKSIAGISQSQAWVEQQGLSFDRRFMVTRPDGSMITARKHPQLVKVSAALLSNGLVLSYPQQPSLKLQYSDFAMTESEATVWKDTFNAYLTTKAADDWFSTIIGEPVQLLFTGEQSQRLRAKISQNVSFADGYPMLIISEASLDALNARSPQHHTMDQFRTNLVVSGTEPFAEDGWKRIRIGDVEFEAVKPCSRCILTTVDPATGEFNQLKEPLNTLSSFRSDGSGEVYFGQNLVALNEGLIRSGDKVEVLETKPKEIYPDNGTQSLTLTCVEREEIARDFCTFWLEPAKQQSLPTYQPGQHLPIQVEINGEYVARRYTLSSSPSRPGRFGISVKRVDDGRISNWLHDHFQVGDTLVAEQPDGSFHLGHHTDKLLLLSAGSGVTPMISMLRYLADHDQVRDVIFYHQCRSQADIPYLDELKKLEKQFPQLKVMIALSRPDKNWRGLSGRLEAVHLEQLDALCERQVFVCGPNRFMDDAKALMLEAGLDAAQYHQEAFGPLTREINTTKEVTISINGNLFSGDNQKTLLEQAEAAGLNVSNSCRAGFCGACKMTLESGEVDQPDVPALLPGEKESGKVLACCCVPKTDVELVD
ncbi:hybrid-cluster NAD(P)-dependent oxidoreductase [Photobacterium rosenbergii]|uniref:Hybrid-cluster NAD(P)-dependent oxidoreductase n=1 Tax=Photobacterium rosenbergii TaxID=294936 RepID=A0ABU3ZHN3_9GAMM|nr:hybrid-cluster NAD(P)-dependent oxidoreductase [Photobacterium rosenbergii]MDV5169609.1 hybrid-cluster NAD(P)-dependent oxidoreductase [Photobacterium rosenbergii]